jgi:hypothetical protein
MAAGVACAAALGACAPAAAQQPPAGRPGIRHEGDFVSACRYTHSAPDDPIVHPGQPGASHSHDFFANTSTGAGSTLGSLQAAPSLCRREGDTAAYWVPTLSDGAKVVHPTRVLAYYLVAGRDPTSIHPSRPV